MDDRWMRALLRPLDLLAFLSISHVDSSKKDTVGKESKKHES